MLIYYRFNNFCSFNCETEFSMTAAAGKVKKRFPDNYTEGEDGYDLLKTAVIVGENAGGKSNFINSLKYLKSLFVTNTQVKSVRSYVNAMSLSEDKNPVQKFELCFRAKNEKVYIYELQIDENGIVLERLQHIKSKKLKPTIIFEMERKEGNCVALNTGESARINEEDRMYRRLITYYQRLSGNIPNGQLTIGLEASRQALIGQPDALAVMDWMTNILCPESLMTDQEDIRKLEEDMKILKDERFLEIFRMVDYSIVQIEIDEEKPYSKSVIIREGEDGQLFRRELQMDSAGVREFFAWSVYIFRVVYEGKVVFADEMDRVLNPVLSDRIIAFINGAAHTGQFIFSTHNVLHLDLKTYMKEQIYFVSKRREYLTSELYSLADFPDIRYETTKIYEFYMKGILGGTAFE